MASNSTKIVIEAALLTNLFPPQLRGTDQTKQREIYPLMSMSGRPCSGFSQGLLAALSEATRIFQVWCRLEAQTSPATSNQGILYIHAQEIRLVDCCQTRHSGAFQYGVSFHILLTNRVLLVIRDLDGPSLTQRTR